MVAVKEEPRVLVFNNHGVGQYVRIDRLPKWGETIRGQDWQFEQDGGKGSNVAIALGRLKVPTAFLGKIGEDYWGDLGISWMKEAGVDISRIRRSERVNTCTGIILTDHNGRNSIVVGESSSNAMTAEELEADIGYFPTPDILITGFEIREDLALKAAEIAHRRGMRTILNASPMPEHGIDALLDIDILIINWEEACILAQIGGVEQTRRNDNGNREQVIRLVKQICLPGTVIMTLGDEGCMVLENDTCIRIPGVKQKAVDTTGAGDGFLAAFAANLVWGKSITEACTWANRYSAYTVAHRGTIPSYPDRETIERFMNNSIRDI
ncbi:ribokinase [Diplocloster hominis]|uniref:ribokinase n=1 Tax=Diplocloster hominis TaxID=3079010 RepID=UPI0031BBCBE9